MTVQVKNLFLFKNAFLIITFTDETDKDGWTCLHSASLKGHLSIVESLIEKGSDTEAKDKNRKTLLHIASYLDKIDVVKYFVSKGAYKYAIDNTNKTPYYSADNNKTRKLLKRESKCTNC